MGDKSPKSTQKQAAHKKAKAAAAKKAPTPAVPKKK
jgi:hypothetical protein